MLCALLSSLFSLTRDRSKPGLRCCINTGDSSALPLQSKDVQGLSSCKRRICKAVLLRRGALLFRLGSIVPCLTKAKLLCAYLGCPVQKLRFCKAERTSVAPCRNGVPVAPYKSFAFVRPNVLRLPSQKLRFCTHSEAVQGARLEP